MRAARRADLLNLGLRDRRSGWPLEMVLAAGGAGWRITERPVPYLRRAGASKVTGTLRGTLRAVGDMSGRLREATTARTPPVPIGAIRPTTRGRAHAMTETTLHADVGVFGGSGFTHLLDDTETIEVDPVGVTVGPVTIGTWPVGGWPSSPGTARPTSTRPIG